jgi:hypothetical protein
MYPNHYLHVYIGDQEGVSYTCLNESDSSANSLSFGFSSKNQRSTPSIFLIIAVILQTAVAISHAMSLSS